MKSCEHQIIHDNSPPLEKCLLNCQITKGNLGDKTNSGFAGGVSVIVILRIRIELLPTLCAGIDVTSNVENAEANGVETLILNLKKERQVN